VATAIESTEKNYGCESSTIVVRKNSSEEKPTKKPRLGRPVLVDSNR
jgi:hypothetical protein